MDRKRRKSSGLRDQVRKLEALAGLSELDEAAARKVNGGLVRGGPSKFPKLKGTGAIACLFGTGA